MTGATTVPTFNAEIEDIVRTIWSTLVDIPIDVGGQALPTDESTVTSIVHIDGAWHGAVLLQCPMTLAKLMTNAMFQAEGEPTIEEVGDALGELTNMVAGNVKALLPETCAISLPTVALGTNYEINVVGTEPVAVVPFTCDDNPMVVTLVQRAGDSE
jgi:chemotaxis protein CheX